MAKKEFGSVLARRLALYIVLRLFVVGIMVLQFLQKNYDNVFTCILTLILFMIPSIVDRSFNIKLPTTLEVIILCFIFAAEILGEIRGYYQMFPLWDTMLHTINGFLMAAIGFSMIDILNQSPHFHINMSPVFVGFVAFCFSMTIGVLWEFFEFGADRLMLTDMQKDSIYQNVSSVMLNQEGANTPLILRNVEKTVIYAATDGSDAVEIKGFLDIGLADTMKDLLVNCIGAAVFSVFGAFYIHGRGKTNSFIWRFIPRMKTKSEIEETNKQIENSKHGRKKK